MNPESTALFKQNNYQIQHQLGLLKEKFKIEDSAGNPILWVSAPEMSLKKDFQIYSDEATTQKVLDVKIHKVVEMAQTWDISDPATGNALATIKAEPLQSLMAANWKILDPSGNEIAQITENTKDSVLHSVVGGLVPRKYNLISNGTGLGEYDQTYAELMLHLNMDFSADTANRIDRRIGVAAGVIVANKAMGENKKSR